MKRSYITTLAVASALAGAGCGEEERPTFEDEPVNLGPDAVVIENLEYGQFTARVYAVLPPCNKRDAGSTSPCIPAPCVEDDGVVGEWFITMRVDDLELSPYEPQNETLAGETEEELQGAAGRRLRPGLLGEPHARRE